MSGRLEDFKQSLENERSELRVELEAAKDRVEELVFALKEVDEAMERLGVIK